MAKEKNNYYEAKVYSSVIFEILKKELRPVSGKKQPVPFYYIHYQGWNERCSALTRRYDAWTSDVQPWNPETSPGIQRNARRKGEGEKRKEPTSPEPPEKRQAVVSALCFTG